MNNEIWNQPKEIELWIEANNISSKKLRQNLIKDIN